MSTPSRRDRRLSSSSVRAASIGARYLRRPSAQTSARRRVAPPGDLAARARCVLGPPRARPQALGGGITNRNYASRFGEPRPRGAAARARTRPCWASTATASATATRGGRALGIGPEVVAFLREPECLVTAFIPRAHARAPGPRQAGRDRRGRGRLWAASTAARGSRDRFSRLRTSSTATRPRAAARGATPGAFGDLRERRAPDRRRASTRRIPSTRPSRATTTCCPRTSSTTASALRLLDWEYAGMGDRFFDLANLAVNNDARRARRVAARVLLGRAVHAPAARDGAADAVHVRLPRGDVGRRAAGDLRARLRLRGLRRGALRAPAGGAPTRASRVWLEDARGP